MRVCVLVVGTLARPSGTWHTARPRATASRWRVSLVRLRMSTFSPGRPPRRRPPLLSERGVALAHTHAAERAMRRCPRGQCRTRVCVCACGVYVHSGERHAHFAFDSRWQHCANRTGMPLCSFVRSLMPLININVFVLLGTGRGFTLH